MVFQVLTSLALLFLFIAFEHQLGWELQSVFTMIILLTLVNCGAILEQKRWIFYLEYSRMFLCIVALLIYYPSAILMTLVAFALPVSIYYFNVLQRRYLFFVYFWRKRHASLV